MSQERVNDNSNKQVEENLTHNERKRVEVCYGFIITAAVSLTAIGLNRIVVRVLVALEEDAFGARCVHHH